MTQQEAYGVLGLEPGATIDMIKDAYQATAKSTHPDLSGSGSDVEFRRVQEAYDVLKHGHVHAGLKSADVADTAYDHQNTQRTAKATDAAVEFVQAFLENHGIEILFDGSLHKAGAPLKADNTNAIVAFLNREDVDGAWLIDELVGEARIRGIKFAKSDLTRAVRVVMRAEQRGRRNTIVLPLLTPSTAEEQKTAAPVWSRLTEAVFETDPVLATACLQHFIWQVKRKLLNLSVQHHLMPVIWSPVQGGGKTTFVRRFLEPLRELAGPVLLSDFADKRSGDIYRFPALFVDDLEQIEPRLVQPLKGLVSGDRMRRRKLGTSMTEGYEQRTTLIGTANHTIDALVADDTGNRRFASLAFRNGKEETGGDRNVWDAVEATDYVLLWRGVDVFGPAPVAAHLPALVALQEMCRPPGPMLSWLLELDLSSARVKRVNSTYGARASDLHDLFCEQMNSVMTSTLFGISMTRHVKNPDVPYGPRIKKESGWYYPLKVFASDPSDPSDPSGSGDTDALSSSDCEEVA